MAHDYYGSSAARQQDTSRPCWTCHWFAFHTGDHAACLNPQVSPSKTTPEFGCAFWMRETGGDDEIWNPRDAGVKGDRQAIKRYMAERRKLELIRAKVVFGVPNWMPSPEVRGRSGTVDYPPPGVPRHMLLRMEEAATIGPPKPLIARPDFNWPVRDP